MAVRSTMSAIITQVSMMIGDPSNTTFTTQQVQDALDRVRDDVRYEMLTAGPSIINPSGTGTPQYVWADYYSMFGWWETDYQLQGPNFANLTAVASEPDYGHWQFQINVFTSGTAPGQYPPVFITGKAYDVYWAAADLLEIWAAQLSGAYNFSIDGASFSRSLGFEQKLKAAGALRRMARPKRGVMQRNDIETASHGERVPLLGNNDAFTRE